MTRKRVLIVEDNVYVRRLLEVSLTSGYEVVQAASREAAWNQLCTQTPDLVFVDIGLNETQGGFLLLDAMREDERFRTIPVAVVSARSLPHDMQMAKERGANAYLTKPFAVSQLLELAQTLLREKAPPAAQ